MKLDRERVYAELNRRDWKLADLWRAAQALKPSMTQATVWNAANGKRDTSIEVAQAIAAVLDTTVDYLACKVDVPGRPELSPDMPPVTPEIVSLVRFLNSLPPERRTEIARGIASLLDITYSSRISPAMLAGGSSGPKGGVLDQIRARLERETDPAWRTVLTNLIEQAEMYEWDDETIIAALEEEIARRRPGRASAAIYAANGR